MSSRSPPRCSPRPASLMGRRPPRCSPRPTGIMSPKPPKHSQNPMGVTSPRSQKRSQNRPASPTDTRHPNNRQRSLCRTPRAQAREIPRLLQEFNFSPKGAIEGFVLHADGQTVQVNVTSDVGFAVVRGIGQNVEATVDRKRDAVKHPQRRSSGLSTGQPHRDRRQGR